MLSRITFLCAFPILEKEYTLCYDTGHVIRDIQKWFLFPQEQSINHFLEVTDMRYEDKKVEFV